MSNDEVQTVLLFLVLVTLNTYTFMPWKGIYKGPPLALLQQWIGWLLVTAIVLLLVVTLKKVVVA